MNFVWNDFCSHWINSVLLLSCFECGLSAHHPEYGPSVHVSHTQTHTLTNTHVTAILFTVVLWHLDWVQLSREHGHKTERGCALASFPLQPWQSWETHCRRMCVWLNETLFLKCVCVCLCAVCTYVCTEGMYNCVCTIFFIGNPESNFRLWRVMETWWRKETLFVCLSIDLIPFPCCNFDLWTKFVWNIIVTLWLFLQFGHWPTTAHPLLVININFNTHREGVHVFHYPQTPHIKDFPWISSVFSSGLPSENKTNNITWKWCLATWCKITLGGCSS